LFPFDVNKMNLARPARSPTEFDSVDGPGKQCDGMAVSPDAATGRYEGHKSSRHHYFDSGLQRRVGHPIGKDAASALYFNRASCPVYACQPRHMTIATRTTFVAAG
jgi:hypothetical protein